MASAEIMRDYVSRQYGGGWPQKVAKMSDEQVACIYHRMLDKHDRLLIGSQEVSGGKQLSMFESYGYLFEKE